MKEHFLRLLWEIAVLLVLWFVVERFSPDALITKISQVVIFILAVIVVMRELLPMLGIV